MSVFKWIRGDIPPWEAIKFVAAAVIVVPCFILGCRDCVRYVTAGLDPVDYIEDASALPDVLEEVVGCSPCNIAHLELRGSKARAYVQDPDRPARYYQYTFRHKTFDDREWANWDHDFHEVSFDPRADVDYQALQTIVADARSRSNGRTISHITLDRYRPGSSTICVSVHMEDIVDYCNYSSDGTYDGCKS